ncbi:MAG TPA: hypothetical protein VLA12_07720 [Planctomycetaceae bacterium]|nr:hypothetical protein [Planctomycetaceae bacterium]
MFSARRTEAEDDPRAEYREEFLEEREFLARLDQFSPGCPFGFGSFCKAVKVI